jgi:ketosteroid isomerase-like protein
MSENSQVVQLAYEAFGRGDIASLLELVADDVEWSTPKTVPQGGQFHGKAGVGQFFQGLGAAWPTLALDLETMGELGDGIVAGIVRADGARPDGTLGGSGAVHVFTVADGKITRFREYTDLDASLT